MTIEQQADVLFNNIAGWETRALERIGRRINQYGEMSISDVQAINNIAVVKQDMQAITKDLAKVTGYNASQIEKMYSDLLAQQHLENKPLYDYRGKQFVPIADNRELQAIVKGYARATAGEMINLSRTSMLKTIDETGKVLPLEKMYKNTLDKAVMQVSTGATDFHTAMRDSIKALGGNGMRVQYESGATRRLDSAVRQNLLWGAKQASIEYNNLIGEELGCDGIEIDWHSFPRPSHEDMQGQQYSIEGRKVINGVVFEDAYEKGIDGEGGLLNDYGCLHYKTPVILGISEPRYSKEELERLNEQNKRVFEIDGEEYTGYEAKQAMRKLETATREQKSIRDMARASGDKGLVKECNENIKAYKEKYSQISEVTGIKEDTKRMSVVRMGGAAEKTVTETARQSVAKLDLKKINGSMTPNEAKEFEQHVSKTPEIKKAYSVYGDQVSDVRRTKYRGAYYPSSNSVEYSFGGAGENKYATLAHEMGHAIDANAVKDLNLTFKEVDTINSRCVIGSGQRKVFDDKLISSCDEFLEAMRKDKATLAVALEDADVISELKASNASAGVQDFADGLFNTQGRGILRWGHGNSYYNWKYNKVIKRARLENDLVQAYKDMGFQVKTAADAKKIIREYKTASELWANGMSAITVGGDELKFMEKYAPNTVAVILKILGGIQ